VVIARALVIGDAGAMENQVAGPDEKAELEALREEVARLKTEISRLREELRRTRRDQHETPPHYL